VEYLFYGVPLYHPNSGNSNSWPGVIPNSQVVAIPFPQTSPADWPLELYLSPSGIIAWIILVVVCWLVGIGALIGFLQWKEKKQDEQEKKETEHLFSFKAL